MLEILRTIWDTIGLIIGLCLIVYIIIMGTVLLTGLASFIKDCIRNQFHPEVWIVVDGVDSLGRLCFQVYWSETKARTTAYGTNRSIHRAQVL